MADKKKPWEVVPISPEVMKRTAADIAMSPPKFPENLRLGGLHPDFAEHGRLTERQTELFVANLAEVLYGENTDWTDAVCWEVLENVLKALEKCGVRFSYPTSGLVRHLMLSSVLEERPSPACHCGRAVAVDSHFFRDETEVYESPAAAVKLFLQHALSLPKER